ncbi:MAG TPA: DUF2147 domain-containing protein [Verrucomicrobiae bacterium]|jgi:uncharacterized protein (DUF2147 family)|nr:DUF2147 domain-containing protein [Verrucomicrobiae bacterium]
MIRALIFAATLAFTSQAHANSFNGLWRTPVDGGGLIRIAQCGQAFCGEVVDSPRLRENPDQRDVRNTNEALRNRRLMGLRIIEARSTRPNELNDGWVYNPEDGNTYHGSIRLLPDGRLRVTGCAIWPLCRNQIWTRVSE